MHVPLGYVCSFLGYLCVYFCNMIVGGGTCHLLGYAKVT